MNRIAIVIALFFSSCVQNLGEFKATQRFYVINGTITDEFGPHPISIRNTADKYVLLELTELHEAQGRIIDDLENVTALKVLDVGDFETPEHFRAEEGRSYRLEVALTNGIKIISDMETLVAPTEIGEFKYRITEREEIGEGNLIVTKRYVEFYTEFCDAARDESYYK